MKTRTVIVIFSVLFGLLAAVALFTPVKDNSIATAGTFYCRMTDYVDLRTPEMRRKIAEINAQIPKWETVDKWTANEVAQASNDFSKR